MALRIVGAQLESVLAEAVRAYRLARRKASMQKSAVGREQVKALALEFPEFYSSEGPSEYLIYSGRSADNILEGYLRDIGETPNSKRERDLWSELAEIVMTRGERAEQAINQNDK
jgi:hypothetical protein|tara:strand:+ start:102 stop:446 length:345 start_codon:yes stop_codon:yes gene_type:complete